jgi:hypothetical protein
MMGLRELILVALVAVALYGRSGVVKSRQVQTVLPWLSPRRRTGGPSNGARANSASSSRKPSKKPFVLRGNRLFWFLTILAATAIAALIITRAMIIGGASNGLTH